ncbi:MAG TPA: response regulator [Candidatus Acidoferrum sp.]|nr:response regulator [Candidatus Acidoferrum sp.]
MSADRKTVLLVDDDAQFLEVLQSLAQTASGEIWNVLAAQTTALALTTLQTEKVDLIVIDLRMPVVDGVQFLQLIQRKYPHVKKIILSGHVDGSSRNAATQAGAELVLEKPVTPEGFQTVLAALGELLRWQNEEGFRGTLRRVGIEDVIQMECLSRHSLVLEVSSQGSRGRIFIRKGELIHAECGDTIGEAALQQLLALSGGEFRHTAFDEPPTRSLEGSWEFLVMEAARKRDEAASMGAEPEPLPVAEIETTASTEAGTQPPLPVVTELVVCGEDGDVMHAWQSADPPRRAAALALLVECSQRIGATVPVGSLERVEFMGLPERVVARFSGQGAVFVRGTAEHG